MEPETKTTNTSSSQGCTIIQLTIVPLLIVDKIRLHGAEHVNC